MLFCSLESLWNGLEEKAAHKTDSAQGDITLHLLGRLSSEKQRVGKDVEKLETLYLLVRKRNDSTPTENNIEVPQKVKIELPYDLTIPLLGIYLKETKLLSQRDVCTPTLIVVLFAAARICKQPRCSSLDEQIKKMWCINIRWSIISSLK